MKKYSSIWHQFKLYSNRFTSFTTRSVKSGEYEGDCEWFTSFRDTALILLKANYSLERAIT